MKAEMTAVAARHSTVVRRAAILGAVVLGIPLVWIASKTMEKPPELLRNATAKGGWYGACPPETEADRISREKMGLALSPELNDRLAQRFSSGSSEADLISELMKEGFSAPIPCKNHASVKQAGFHRSGFFVETNASIFWKVEGQAVVWTKGFISYIGL